MRQANAMYGWGVGHAGCVVLLAGCAGDRPKSQPSTEAIQQDSDRFFEKLRQEEQERAIDPAHRP